MKMKEIIYPAGIFLALVILVSCNKKGEVIPYEEPDIVWNVDNPTDSLIKDMYDRYQTKIIYKWDQRYISTSAVATPPRFELIYPYIDVVIQKLFVSSYDSQNSEFMRRNLPIQLLLVGSRINYNNGEEASFTGSGAAAQFSRIMVAGINEYNLENRSWLGSQVATLHHELAHALDKKYGRPLTYDEVSKGLYAISTSFTSFTESEARSRGFWRPYGMSNESEDFASFVDGIVGNPEDEVMEIVNQNERLKKKYHLIMNFYKELGIDLHEINKYITSALESDILL